LINQSRRKGANQARMLTLKSCHELAVELHPHKGRMLRLDLDSDLDRDISLDSLGRAELLLRLDREFKVRLPDSLMGDARWARDLLEGVLAASPTLPPRAIEAMGRVEPAVMEPIAAATLIEMLAAREFVARMSARLCSAEHGLRSGVRSSIPPICCGSSGNSIVGNSNAHERELHRKREASGRQATAGFQSVPLCVSRRYLLAVHVPCGHFYDLALITLALVRQRKDDERQRVRRSSASVDASSLFVSLHAASKARASRFKVSGS
jgi:hypothetical protein